MNAYAHTPAPAPAIAYGYRAPEWVRRQLELEGAQVTTITTIADGYNRLRVSLAIDAGADEAQLVAWLRGHVSGIVIEVYSVRAGAGGCDVLTMVCGFAGEVV